MDAQPEQLGFRSKLVLMKLGFDLRQAYAQTANEPLGPRLQDLVDQLMGYAPWRDVGRVDQPDGP